MKKAFQKMIQEIELYELLPEHIQIQKLELLATRFPGFVVFIRGDK